MYLSYIYNNDSNKLFIDSWDVHVIDYAYIEQRCSFIILIKLYQI